MNLQNFFQGRNVRFRSGQEVSIDQFKWRNGEPSGTDDKIAIKIRKNGRDSRRGIVQRACKLEWSERSYLRINMMLLSL